MIIPGMINVKTIPGMIIVKIYAQISSYGFAGRNEEKEYSIILVLHTTRL